MIRRSFCMGQWVAFIRRNQFQSDMIGLKKNDNSHRALMLLKSELYCLSQTLSSNKVFLSCFAPSKSLAAAFSYVADTEVVFHIITLIMSHIPHRAALIRGVKHGGPVAQGTRGWGGE